MIAGCAPPASAFKLSGFMPEGITSKAAGVMTLILGIDPGSRITGYGVVQDTGRGCVYVASGCIRTGNGEMHERLQIVYRGVREVIQTYGPVTMGIEKVFMGRNADSALKLGQARGARSWLAVKRAWKLPSTRRLKSSRPLQARGRE